MSYIYLSNKLQTLPALEMKQQAPVAKGTSVSVLQGKPCLLTSLVYSQVSPAVFSEAYSQISVYKIAGLILATCKNMGEMAENRNNQQFIFFFLPKAGW